MPENRVSSEDILMRCDFKGRGGKERMLFLKMFMFVAVGYRLVMQVDSAEMCCKIDFGELMILRW